MGWPRHPRPKRSLLEHLLRYVCCNSEEDWIDWWEEKDREREEELRRWEESLWTPGGRPVTVRDWPGEVAFESWQLQYDGLTETGAAFRGQKLRINKPPEVKNQMVTIHRPRQINPDLLEERERQYYDALSRDVNGARDVTKLTTVDQRDIEEQVTERHHHRPPEPPSELDDTVRAFLDHVITLAVTPPQPPELSEHGTSGGGPGPPLPPAPSKQSSLYLDAAKDRAQLTSAESRREEEAAVKIQSSWRGHQVRKSLKPNKPDDKQPAAKSSESPAKVAKNDKPGVTEDTKPPKTRKRVSKTATKVVHTAPKVKGTRPKETKGPRNRTSTKYSYNMAPSRTTSRRKPSDTTL
ncbi:uncharacterized protein LOC122384748 isoform X2 [Amphibalanus amphitrite]|uniref:uncharacterized protein LOC122384748 isoform X2 n=1 Tax=Amphibalanus amphitrite TaxID=1232801 RepID=UPI001C9297D1|nr:uncharacterized protein LOC122384748 isoform X2 [Amphibalanus amphitrite]